MSPLSAEQILRVWERGAALPAAERVLAILAEMEPGAGVSTLARLPLGRRDRQLLELRARTFGRQLRARVACPECRAILDITFLADDLHAARAGDLHRAGADDLHAARADELGAPLAPPHDLDAPAHDGIGAAEQASPAHLPHARFRARDFDLVVRAPDSVDLIAASACADLDDARRLLARRCIVAAQRVDASVDAPVGTPVDVSVEPPVDTAVDAEAIPDDLLPALATFLETIDPDAEQRLEGQCPTCDARWESAFDIAGFLWMEIEVEAMRLLHDVHVIAHGYGWREVDILAMTPLRRRAYLELLS